MIPCKVSSIRQRFIFSGLFLTVMLGVATRVPADASVDRFAGIAPKMQGFVDKGDVCGIVTLVADKDKVLHLAAVGKSDVASGRQMQADDLFWIASMSKPITAVCVAMLVDDGKLSFDDPVGKYLPQFHKQWVIDQRGADKRSLVKDAKPITIRNLLTHTSGMGEYVVTDPHWSLGEMSIASARAAAISDRQQMGLFHRRHRCGGARGGSRQRNALRGVHAEATARSAGDENTTFWVAADDEKRLAKSYRQNAQTEKLEEATISYMYGGAVTDHARPALGGAGLFSTAADVAKFYQMTLDDGSFHGKRILKSETLAEMTHNQIGDLTARPGMPWGLGFCVVQDPKAMEANVMLPPGSFGHGGAYGTNSWVDPKRGVVYVIMLQRRGAAESG